MAEIGKLAVLEYLAINLQLYVTQSGKLNRAYCLFKVSRNAGLKYLVCCSLPMVEVMCTVGY